MIILWIFNFYPNNNRLPGLIIRLVWKERTVPEKQDAGLAAGKSNAHSPLHTTHSGECDLSYSSGKIAQGHYRSLQTDWGHDGPEQRQAEHYKTATTELPQQ